MIHSIDEIKEFRKQNQTTYWPSRFAFLKTFNGLRPQTINLILAGSGVGKTTLHAGMVSDCMTASRNPKVNVFLTEETSQQFLKILYDYTDNEYLVKKNLTITRYSDISEKIQDDAEFLNYMESKIIEMDEGGITFLDNITTLPPYTSSHVTRQNKFAERFRTMAERYDHTFVVFGHPDPKITLSSNRMLNHEDIRYGKSFPLESSYCWTMNQIQIGDKSRVFIKNTKFRGSDKPEKTYFGLHFEKGIFKTDIPMPFKEIEQVWKDRNKF